MGKCALDEKKQEQDVQTRPAQDNSQKVDNSQEVEGTTSTFGTFGRYTEIPLDQMTREQRTGYDFEVKERGEVPGPHKI